MKKKLFILFALLLLLSGCGSESEAVMTNSAPIEDDHPESNEENKSELQDKIKNNILTDDFPPDDIELVLLSFSDGNADCSIHSSWAKTTPIFLTECYYMIPEIKDVLAAYEYSSVEITISSQNATDSSKMRTLTYESDSEISLLDSSENDIAVQKYTYEDLDPLTLSDDTGNSSTSEEASPDQFVAEVQASIQGDVGSGETIKEVILDSRKLYVYVDFSQGDFSTFSAADIARSRTSSITDDILALDQYDSLWDSIVVDFGSVGYIENSREAIKDEGYGRFFDLDSSFSDDHIDDNAVIAKAEAPVSDPPSLTVEEPQEQPAPVSPETEPQLEEPAPVEEPPAPEVEEEKPVGDEVWLSATGDKYHRINNCGRMNPDNASKVSLEEALRRGKTKCSKCY